MNLWIPICLVKNIFIATFTSIVSSIMIKMFKAMMPQEFFSVVEWLIEFLPSPSLPLFTPILSLPFNCTIIFTEGNRLSWTYCWDQLNQRSISQRCKGRLFTPRSDFWIIKSGWKEEMLWDITQLVNENHMQECQDTGRNLFRDGFFFTVYTGLKNLCISHSLTMYPYLPLTGKAELPQTSGLYAEHMLTQNPWKNCDSCPEIIFLKFTVLWAATISTLNSRSWEGKELSDWINVQQTVTQRVDMCLGKTTFLYCCS